MILYCIQKFGDIMEKIINVYKIQDKDKKINALKQNCKIAIELRSEISKMQKNFDNEIKEVFNNSVIDNYESNSKEKEDFEYDYYYIPIKNINVDSTYEQIQETIEENLPSKNNSNYTKLINRIKSEIYKELIQLYRLLAEFKEDIESEKEIKKLIDLENIKFKIINNHEENKIQENEKKENRFIFFETKNGNIYCINDLRKIKKEYYESFKELFISIKNGTFKNVKRLTSTNTKISSISEVRGFKTRIIFDRISPSTYIIIMCAVKKSDFDMGYKKTLEERCLQYKFYKDEIISKQQKKEFIKESINIEKSLFLKLSNKKVKIDE